MAHRAQTIPMGFNQATPAMQQTLRQATGSGFATASRGRKRRSGKLSRKAATVISRARSKSSSNGSRGKVARLVKGSAAAKRYMAKIRKLRR